MFYLCFLRFCSSFSPRWFCGVTLVTAKKQHRCWKARAYSRVHVRVRMRTIACVHDVKEVGHQLCGVCETVLHKMLLSLDNGM